MIERMRAAALEAGKIIKNADRSELLALQKSGDRNFVTKYDVLVQKFLKNALAEAVPEAAFVGEEDDGSGKSGAGTSLCWIVDPIDGTSNFMHDLRCSAVSIALCDRKENKTLAGVIYNPYSDELFSAEAGAGAFLNGEKITVSRRAYRDALLGFGTTPYTRSLADRTFAIAREMYTESLDIRRSGAAAADLANIAAGRLDGFFELSLSPWDYAAGALLIAEAGGIVTNLSGGPLNLSKPDGVVAGNAEVYPELMRIIGSH